MYEFDSSGVDSSWPIENKISPPNNENTFTAIQPINNNVIVATTWSHNNNNNNIQHTTYTSVSL